VHVSPREGDARTPVRVNDQASRRESRRPPEGFSFDSFDMLSDSPTLHVGSNSAQRCYIFIQIEGVPVLWIKPPERPGGPFRLNADFADRDGKPTVRIVDNEARMNTGTWDVVTEGPRITIRSAPGKIDLVLRTNPPNDFYVERIAMETHGYALKCEDGKKLIVDTPLMKNLQLSGMRVSGFPVGITINKGSVGIGSMGLPACMLNDA
jgi:hypothetical protein